ncbi:hypothetical protein GE09DRAFT_1069792, partial [Coniochaeta sp. 2T2.1]
PDLIPSMRLQQIFVHISALLAGTYALPNEMPEAFTREILAVGGVSFNAPRPRPLAATPLGGVPKPTALTRASVSARVTLGVVLLGGRI